ARYRLLDDIVSQRQSSDYNLPRSSACEPFQRTALHTIPDSVFEQYNRATSHTMMGLFAEFQQASITVENRLYLWDYVTPGYLQGYEPQPNNITAVRQLSPKPGAFIRDVNYVLVIATTLAIPLLVMLAVTNARGGRDVTLFETKVSVPIKGHGVSVIEGSKKTGRIFFGGRGDNDICEFTYMMVIDDTRNLLYTLSSKSATRAFHIKGESAFSLSISHSFSQMLANIRLIIGNRPLQEPKTRNVSISPMTSQQARRTHSIATVTTGCRHYMSAVASESVPDKYACDSRSISPSNGTDLGTQSEGNGIRARVVLLLR
ncbi:hypothetical protein HOY82DRAFT_647193, partial [Tuber indicum]